MRIQAEPLKKLVAAIFHKAGCDLLEAEQIAEHLVEANLAGHDSHGVIRIPIYIQWLREGVVVANRRMQVVFENDVIAVVDGQFGFGQAIGVQAMELGIAKVKKHGAAVIALRNCGHLGRIGAWAIQAAAAGLVSLHFVNTSGRGLLVAPFGGIDRRMSANPIAIGVPVDGKSPIILDISTSMIAEGKIKVAHNKGVPVPDNCIIDSEGRPTNDPKVFYANPPGVILPFGGHKGYGLSLVTEFLAGALTGGGCSDPKVTRMSNGMLSILLDPQRFPCEVGFGPDIRRYIEFVRSSRTVTPGGEILMPGEVEERMRAKRLREGIDLDHTTTGQIRQAGQTVGLTDESIDAVISKV